MKLYRLIELLKDKGSPNEEVYVMIESSPYYSTVDSVERMHSAMSERGVLIVGKVPTVELSSEDEAITEVTFKAMNDLLKTDTTPSTSEKKKKITKKRGKSLKEAKKNPSEPMATIVKGDVGANYKDENKDRE